MMEEMPLRRNNSGKGAIELMTEEVIDDIVSWPQFGTSEDFNFYKSNVLLVRKGLFISTACRTGSHSSGHPSCMTTNRVQCQRSLN